MLASVAQQGADLVESLDPTLVAPEQRRVGVHIEDLLLDIPAFSEVVEQDLEVRMPVKLQDRPQDLLRRLIDREAQ